MSDTYYDGSFDTPIQDGPAVPWQDRETRSTLFNISYLQKAEKWKPEKMSAKGPKGAILVEEGQPRDTGVAGVIGWTRTYAQIPKQRQEAEGYVYTAQSLLSGNIDIFEITYPTNSILLYDYFATAKPAEIEMLFAARLGMRSGTIYRIGGTLSSAGEARGFQRAEVAPSGLIVAEDSQIRRWRGDIWERRTRLVKPQTVRAFIQL